MFQNKNFGWPKWYAGNILKYLFDLELLQNSLYNHCVWEAVWPHNGLFMLSICYPCKSCYYWQIFLSFTWLIWSELGIVNLGRVVYNCVLTIEGEGDHRIFLWVKGRGVVSETSKTALEACVFCLDVICFSNQYGGCYRVTGQVPSYCGNISV